MDKKTKISIGELTESELEIVLDSLQQVCHKFNITMSKPAKPKPMWREVEISGDWQNVMVVECLIDGYCKVIR